MHFLAFSCLFTHSTMHHFASPEILEARIAPAVFIVTSNADSSGATAGDGTLRGEILAANAHHGSNELKFASGISAITLTSGAISITNTLLIDGPGASHLTITGDGSAGIFSVSGKGAATTFDGLTFASGVATGNSQATDNGGAIASSATITVENSVFAGNKANYGGAICVSPEGLTGNITASLTVKDTQFHNNSSSNSGGAIWMGSVNGSLSIVGSTLGGAGFGNSSDLAGGAVYCTTNAFLLSHSIVSENSLSGSTTGNGGGLFVETGSIQILNSSIISNTATSSGGGAYMEALGSAGKVVISGSSFSGNTTNHDTNDTGGGLMLDGAESKLPAIITNTAFLANTSQGNAGGVIFQAGSVILNGVVVGSNTAAGDGGGIESTASLTMVGGSIFGNTSAGSLGGGGIAASGGVSITSTHITDNSTSGSSAGGGGILDLTGSAPLKMVAAVVSSNVSRIGSGIAVSGTFPIAITKCSIVGNQSSYNGGGLYSATSGAVTLSGDTFTSNTLATQVGSSVTAAGASIIHASSVKISSVSFTGNSGVVGTSNPTVGGLYVNGANASTIITITGSHFAQNSGFSAGGLEIGSTGVATVSGISATDNIAYVFAGGFEAGPNTTLLASTISGNVNPNYPSKSNTYGQFKT